MAGFAYQVLFLLHANYIHCNKQQVNFLFILLYCYIQ